MTLLERYRLAKLCWKLAGEINPQVKVRAHEVMCEVGKQEQSGEWKRHQVYAQLIKEFPHISRKSIAFTIEVCKCCG